MAKLNLRDGNRVIAVVDLPENNRYSLRSDGVILIQIRIDGRLQHPTVGRKYETCTEGLQALENVAARRGVRVEAP